MPAVDASAVRVAWAGRAGAWPIRPGQGAKRHATDAEVARVRLARAVVDAIHAEQALLKGSMPGALGRVKAVRGSLRQARGRGTPWQRKALARLDKQANQLQLELAHANPAAFSHAASLVDASLQVQQSFKLAAGEHNVVEHPAGKAKPHGKGKAKKAKAKKKGANKKKPAGKQKPTTKQKPGNKKPGNKKHPAAKNHGKPVKGHGKPNKGHAKPKAKAHGKPAHGKSHPKPHPKPRRTPTPAYSPDVPPEPRDPTMDEDHPGALPRPQ